MEINHDERNSGSMIICNHYQDKGRKAKDVIEEYIYRKSTKGMEQFEHDRIMCYTFLDKKSECGLNEGG